MKPQREHTNLGTTEEGTSKSLGELKMKFEQDLKGGWFYK